MLKLFQAQTQVEGFRTFREQAVAVRKCEALQLMKDLLEPH